MNPCVAGPQSTNIGPASRRLKQKSNLTTNSSRSLRSTASPRGGRPLSAYRLACYRSRDVAGEIRLAEGLNRTAGQSVIGSHDGSDLAMSRINRLQHKKVRLGRQPVFGIRIGDHLDVAPVDIGLQNAHLCVMQSFRTLVTWRTCDQDTTPLGRRLYQIVRLHPADPHPLHTPVTINLAG